MKKFYKYLIFLFLLATLLPVQIFAQSRGQIIEPVFTILDLKRNDTYKDNIRFTNDLSASVTLELDLSVSDFRVGSNGTDKEEIQNLPPDASLASWISLPIKHISVPQGKSVTVPFIIKVPANADYGGKYASISFQPSSDSVKSDQQIPITTRVQHTILVNIEGKRIESLEIANFKSDKTLYDDTFSLLPFSDKSTDVGFTTEIRNTGNVHISPRGKISVTGGWFGGGEDIDYNPANRSSLGYVLPDKNITRTFNAKWSDDKFRIGPYKAIVTLEYESNGSTVTTTSTVTFWIFPWKIISFFLVIIILILIIIFVVKKFKRRRILKKKLKKQ